MKSYLDLVSLSVKGSRRKSRLTRFCIILAVFLVASIFGMADMAIRCQKTMAIRDDGAWHAAFQGITEEQAGLIAARPEVETASFYAAMNYRLDMDYKIGGTKAVICGFDKDFLTLYPAVEIVEGEYPQTADEAVLTQSVQKRMDLRAGDEVSLSTPDGSSVTYTVSGFTGETSMLTKWDAFGIFLNKEGYMKSFRAETLQEDFTYYVAFQPFCHIQKTLDEICSSLDISQDQVAQNTKYLALMLQSDNSFILSLYLSAAILAVLVIIAGILMIANSLNTMISKRTEFFGMLRCLGASPKQVVRFVRLEALYWCRTAIPAGLCLSVVVIWILCAALRYISPGYFSGMPVFGISWTGLVAGAAIGILTVLLAAHSPARKASRVSPLTAVSGNAGTIREMKRSAKSGFFKIPAALGIHHAKSSKKNMFLMSGSYAFSIVLFLAFTPAIDFMDHAITPLRPYTPDLSIYSEDNSPGVSDEIVEKIKNHPAVKISYGRYFKDSVTLQTEQKAPKADAQSAANNRQGSGTRKIHLISYDETQFHWADDALVKGSIEKATEGSGILIDYPASQSLSVGSLVTLKADHGSASVPVTGILSSTPFNSNTGVVICSEELFRQICGNQEYAVLDIQLAGSASEQDVKELRTLAGDSLSFSDQRMNNQEVRGTYWAFALFVYGFLFIIALIAVFHIINSIGMSVSSRMSLFGTMRAVGMTTRQLTHMIICEAAVYVTGGILLGLLAGLPLHYILYTNMITSKWGDSWTIPVSSLAVISIITLGSLFPATADPSRRIREMSVVDTIHEQ